MLEGAAQAGRAAAAAGSSRELDAKTAAGGTRDAHACTNALHANTHMLPLRVCKHEWYRLAPWNGYLGTKVVPRGTTVRLSVKAARK